MWRPKPSRYCCHSSCKNNSGIDGVHFYRFPKEESRCEAWVKVCDNKKLLGIPASELNRKYYLCSGHFQDWCFMNIISKHRLVHNAIPDSPKPDYQERSDASDTVSLDNASSSLSRIFCPPQGKQHKESAASDDSSSDMTVCRSLSPILYQSQMKQHKNCDLSDAVSSSKSTCQLSITHKRSNHKKPLLSRTLTPSQVSCHEISDSSYDVSGDTVILEVPVTNKHSSALEELSSAPTPSQVQPHDKSNDTLISDPVTCQLSVIDKLCSTHNEPSLPHKLSQPQVSCQKRSDISDTQSSDNTACQISVADKQRSALKKLLLSPIINQTSVSSVHQTPSSCTLNNITHSDESNTSVPMANNTSPIKAVNSKPNIIYLSDLAHKSSISSSLITSNLTSHIVGRKYSPRELRLAREIKKQRNVARRLRLKYENIKKQLKDSAALSLKTRLIRQGVNEKLASFIERQVELNLQKKKEFTEYDKVYAYHIFSKSKAVYRTLKELLEFPSERTLRRYIASESKKNISS